NPVRLANVFSGSLPSLLVYQITVTKRRFLVCIQFKKRSFSHELVGRRDGIVAWACNFPRAIFCELILAQLEKTNIRSGSLLWIKIRFDFGNRSHKAKIQAESIGCSFNLLKHRANLNVSQRI